MSQQRVGAHLSTAAGIPAAVARAASLGADALQVFSGSPRMWRRTPLEKIDASAVLAAEKQHNVSPIFTHALYIVNLASDDEELVAKSTNALSHDLRFDAHISGAGVVVHVGSCQGRGWDNTRDFLAERIIKLLVQTPENSRMLIENAASRNGKVGGDLAEISWLITTITAADSKLGARLGWCFDTCHGFAAGYSLSPTVPAGQLTASRTITELKLWEKLWCVHVNDSRDPFASNRDRHANIGDGLIPNEDLRAFLNVPQLSKIPCITEVPGIAGDGPDAENIARIRALLAA